MMVRVTRCLPAAGHHRLGERRSGEQGAHLAHHLLASGHPAYEQQTLNLGDMVLSHPGPLKSCDLGQGRGRHASKSHGYFFSQAFTPSQRPLPHTCAHPTALTIAQQRGPHTVPGIARKGALRDAEPRNFCLIPHLLSSHLSTARDKGTGAQTVPSHPMPTLCELLPSKLKTKLFWTQETVILAEFGVWLAKFKNTILSYHIIKRNLQF